MGLPMHARSVSGLATVVLLLSLAGCGKAPEQGPPPPMEISVAVVPERDITEWDEYIGRLEAVNTVEIRPQVSGYLQEVKFAEGKEVKKGDLLFQIDPRPFQAELDRVLAQVDQARTAEELAQTDLTRAGKLLATRAISQEEYDQRVASQRSATASLKAAQASVQGEIGRAHV